MHTPLEDSGKLAKSKRMKPLLLILAAALSLSLHAEECIAKISVTGNASQKTPNDAAAIQLGIENNAPSRKEAEEKTKEAMSSLVAWIKGFKDTLSSSTTALNIYPIFNNRDNTPSSRKNLPIIIGYQSSALITSEVEAATAGAFMAEATDHGATSVNGVSFHIKDATAAKLDGVLLTEAFNNARERARILVNAADKSLGGAIRIQATQNSTPNPIMPMARAFTATADSTPSTPFQTEPGDSTLNSSVTIDFELLPAASKPAH